MVFRKSLLSCRGKFLPHLPLVAMCLLLPVSSSVAQDRIAGAPPVRSDQWAMEQIHRKGKETLHGLVLRKRKNEIEFIEVVRPKGRPMYLVVHHLQPDEIAKIDELEQSQRQKLYDRIIPLLAFKSRIQIEQLRMEDVELKEVVRDERLWWLFECPWFAVESTAGDESTRRCVIQIAQTFAAFRHLLPPRVRPDKRLSVVIFGSMDEYRSRLNVVHPAFYEQGTNTIYAASEMKRFARRLAQVRAQTILRRQQYRALDKDMPNRLAGRAQKLRANGHTEQEIKLELRALTGAWRREYQSKLSQLNQISRRNESLFLEVCGEMFQRLKHEAFHAYLENFVFPHDRHDVPHWLNEGIAQLFEYAQLDSDRFRLDAANPRLLDRLQTELKEGRQLPIAEVIRGDAQAFWASHNNRAASNRFYLYSWGLAHYLVFEHHLLAGKKFEDFVTRGSANLPPEVRLEALTGLSMEKLQQRWREYILKLKSEG